MGTIEDKLKRVLDTKKDIRRAIDNKLKAIDSRIGDYDAFSTYANVINEYLNCGKEEDLYFQKGECNYEGMMNAGFDPEVIDNCNKYGVDWFASENDSYILTDEDIGSANLDLDLNGNFNRNIKCIASGHALNRGTLSNAFSDMQYLKFIGSIQVHAGQLNAMFSGCRNMTYIDDINVTIDNPMAVILERMFYECTSLKRISEFYVVNSVSDPSSVGLNLNGMFKDCKSLLELPRFNMSECSIQYMADMFNGCKSLIDVGVDLDNDMEFSMDLSRTYSIENAFAGCESLEEIRLINVNMVTQIDFSDSPALSDESILSILRSSEPSYGNLTIILHNVAYDRAIRNDEISSLLSNKFILQRA